MPGFLSDRLRRNALEDFEPLTPRVKVLR